MSWNFIFLLEIALYGTNEHLTAAV